MFAPLYSMTPGMHVSVVNSYDAASLSVAVKVLRRVDYKQKKVLYGNHKYKLKTYSGLNTTHGQILI
jgi:hypothetical protein